MKTRRADEKKERNRNALHPIRFEWTGSIDSSMRWDVKLMTAATLPLHLRRFIIANEHFALHKHPRQYISSEHSFFFLVFFFWHFCSRPCIAAAVKVVVDSILLLPAEEWFFFLILFIFVAAKGTDRAAAHADNRPLDVSSLPGYQFWLLMSRGSINKTKRIQAGENTHTHTHTRTSKEKVRRPDPTSHLVTSAAAAAAAGAGAAAVFFLFLFSFTRPPLFFAVIVVVVAQGSRRTQFPFWFLWRSVALRVGVVVSCRCVHRTRPPLLPLVTAEAAATAAAAAAAAAALIRRVPGSLFRLIIGYGRRCFLFFSSIFHSLFLLRVCSCVCVCVCVCVKYTRVFLGIHLRGHLIAESTPAAE